MIAMIFAIGMSFANIDSASDADTDYILTETGFEPIGREFNCQTGSTQCKVEMPDGQIYDLYDAPNSPKVGDGTVFKL